ncbi:MAG TPA: hypothetical protein VNI02_25190 [Blastocatellia bacterium]|jgi:hypothetical protein|nr:hypothetical protein [Blastocatellia bacterium]
MNLNVIIQALNGGVVISDPVRDREFKRARKQISDGIQGSAIGAALLVASALSYFLIPRTSWVYAISLALALAGITMLFRSIGRIVDAKIGPKLLDPALQPRGTGGLSLPVAQSPAIPVRPSQRLSPDSSKTNGAQPSHTRPVSVEGQVNAPSISPAPFDENLIRPGTGRINREHSSPLRKLEKEDDLLSKLRN